ncbi:MAG: sel1 repeat family protein, partial [Rikenellaceae bacterium]|nr:sel1 repeat family protein [Rikenellaceae bacterium]
MNRQIELLVERAIEGEEFAINGLEVIRKNKDIEEWLNVANAYYQKGNYDQADEWFSLAAEQGSGTAALYLGDIYGEKENYSEAAKWYLFAAERG